MTTPLHRTPRVYPLHRSAVTSLQLLNVLMLAVWTWDLILHYERYQQSPNVAALKIFGNVYWWAWTTGITFAFNALPLVPWWARTVNRTYILKRAGLIAAAMWWAFLAAVFWFVGSDLFTGIHAALAIACLFEAMRIMRTP